MRTSRGLLVGLTLLLMSLPADAQQRGAPATPSISELEASRKRAVLEHPPGRGPEPDLAAPLQRAHAAALLKKNEKIRSLAAKLVPSRTSGACGATKIDAISASPPIEPGEEIILNGCFPAGELRLVGQFPSGHVKLDILTWFPHAINARVPASLTGVVDHAATLQVVTQDSTLSNALPIRFKAHREIVQLGHVLSFSCAQPYVGCMTFDEKQIAEHKASDMVALGVDTISAALVNGWTLAGMWWGWWDKGSPGKALAQSSGFVNGAATATVKMHWAAWGTGAVEYEVALYGIGPAGVSPVRTK